MKKHFGSGDQDFTDFYLIGHSFSAYIAANYALKFPFHVRKLILSSPHGVQIMIDDQRRLTPVSDSGNCNSELKLN